VKVSDKCHRAILWKSLPPFAGGRLSQTCDANCSSHAAQSSAPQHLESLGKENENMIRTSKRVSKLRKAPQPP